MLLNRVLASLLSEIGRVDPAVLGGAAALIVATAFVACLVPALGATRLDPVAALKKD
jgi:ABC-type antimicrobial peptide transport system permease subunit